MAKRENPNEIPKKFRSLKNTVLKNLKEKNSDSFKAFPKELNFLDKERDENIVLVLRTPFFRYIPQMIAMLLTLLLPLIIYLPISEEEGSRTFMIAMMLIAVMIVITFLIFAVLRWYYNVGIITDKRVLDIDFHNIMSHSVAEARLEKIVDITVKQKGIEGSIFDVADIHIQTAGSNPEIVFSKIPRARDVQNILYELLENRKKGKI
ncbi:MAG: PH domain-containing protein [Candidatus Dojkabacteria bacterium]|jgi:hypothetical protein|nr:PH domain-containing protein [Candidatus Dojkabacteria bacterium]MDD4561224.1 PH domain-containing protein [Candidatus Dojkabacteria bacterium]